MCDESFISKHLGGVGKKIRRPSLLKQQQPKIFLSENHTGRFNDSTGGDLLTW